jgi:hypothetical protein
MNARGECAMIYIERFFNVMQTPSDTLKTAMLA